MKLIYKEVKSLQRGMYLYYPQGCNRTAFKRCSITVLRDEDDEESVLNLLFNTGLAELSEREQIILSFPNPVNHCWNSNFSKEAEDDIKAFSVFQDAMTKADDNPLEFHPNGFPTDEAMMSTWHPMNDTKYLIGLGSGADMACTLAACAPDNIAAVLCLEGGLCKEALEHAVYSVMPAFLVNCRQESVDYFVKADAAELVDENMEGKLYQNLVNPLQCVMETRRDGKFDKEILNMAWERLFYKVRRSNTGPHGDCEPRMDFRKAGFEIFLDDDRLEEKVKTPHTWFTYVPEWVKKDPKLKVPLMVFFHGGSDNPAEAAEMSKFHELGEREGFITVYPWGTNRASWNSNMEKDGADDVGFAVALIRYMIANYPVDPERVYLSGFSNGAAHAQVVALTHPELIAAICHIDSNWPGKRVGPTKVVYEEITPFRLALEKKKQFDYRIPVWYTYGSREPSYPVYNGCSQQNQYDFWKLYNNIEIVPTPEQEHPHPCGCGVPGEKYELLTPSKRHPHHQYDVQRFYAKDGERQNLYNYVLMRDKGHDIAEKDPELGWNYVKQFRRLPDGHLGFVKEGD